MFVRPGVVVDLGCVSHEGARDASVPKLIGRFKPDVLYGFDPWLAREPGWEQVVHTEMIDATMVLLEAKAAWTHEGSARLSLGQRGYDSTVMRENAKWSSSSELVPCFQFSTWLRRITHNLRERVVVKMDIEGAEVPILESMHRERTDELVDLLLVEWHDRLFDGDYTARREVVEHSLRCRIEKWD